MADDLFADLEARPARATAESPFADIEARPAPADELFGDLEARPSSEQAIGQEQQSAGALDQVKAWLKDTLFKAITPIPQLEPGKEAAVSKAREVFGQSEALLPEAVTGEAKAGPAGLAARAASRSLIPLPSPNLAQGVIEMAVPVSPLDILGTAAGAAIPSMLKHFARSADEVLAVGTAPVFKTAPTATGDILRAVSEVQDPVLRKTLMRDTAWTFLGPREAGFQGARLPGHKVVQELDPVIDGILKTGGEESRKVFLRGLESLAPADQELLGGKALAKKIAKASGEQDLGDIVQSLSPSQQRVVMRRGLDQEIGQLPGDPLKELSLERQQLTRSINQQEQAVQNFVRTRKATPGALNEQAAKEAGLLKSREQLAELDATIENLSTSGPSPEQLKITEAKTRLQGFLQELDNPTQLAPDQMDNLTSLAVRENLDQSALATATQGSRSMPLNLDKVEAALSARATTPGILQRIDAGARKLGNEVVDLFEFEQRLKKFPQTRFEFARMQGVPLQASREGVATIKSILEPIQKLKPEAYDTFRKFIILQDWKAALESGSTKIVNNLSLEEVNGALAKLAPKIRPEILEAAERHNTVVGAIGKDLVRRGYLTQDMLKDKYFTHRVIKYLDESAEVSASRTKGTRTPFRSYVLERVPNAELIDTDYIGVMHRHLAKVKIDNAIDDFVRAEAGKLDVLPTLPDESRLKLFGANGQPIVGKLYDIDGKMYKGYKYSPKGLLYPGQSESEEIMAKALDEALSPADLDARLRPINENLELRKTYLVPEEAADSFVRFNQPQNLSHLFTLIKGPVRLWKKVTLTTAGVPWQMRNFISSIEALYREGDLIGTLAQLPRAGKALAKAHFTSKDLDPLFLKARESGIIQGGRRSVRPVDDLELWKYIDFPEKAVAAAKMPWDMAFQLSSEASEGAVRLAKFMADSERIQRGQAVVTKSFAKELAGLAPEQQVIQNVRLMLPEVAVNDPKFNRVVGDLTFPFISWFYHNSKGWAKYIANNPGDLAVKYGLPYAGMQYWNWKNYPEVEKKLPEYQRFIPHIITGYKDEKGRHIVYNLQSTLQAASQWFAMDAMAYRASQVAQGQMGLEEAVRAQVQDTARAPYDTAVGLLNPVLNAMRGLATNQKKKQEGGGVIVPKALEGTRQAAELRAQYVLSQLAAPFGVYMRTERRQEAEPVNPIARFFKFGPLDWQRGLGISRVDLERAERQMRMERGEEAKYLNNQNLADLEDAFVKSQVTGDSDGYMKILERERGKIYLPPGTSIASHLRSPRIQLRILRDQFSAAKSVEERERLLQEIKDMEEVQSLKAIKGAPKQERSFILDGEEAQ